MGAPGRLLSDSMPMELCDSVARAAPLSLGEIVDGLGGGPHAVLSPPVAAGDRALDRPLYEACKRGLDVLIALALLVLTSPVTLLAALAIKVSDFGPMLYVHTRVGRRGREFRCYKFRSMIVDAHRLQVRLQSANRHADHRTFKLEEDPRVTRVGRLIRKMSIDELPQLWNVLRGDMSMVGPRPPVPDEVKLYSEADRRRLDVRPGLTCIWQVSGRSNIPFPEQLRMDMEYVRRRSLRLDLALLLKTIPAVLSCRGAW
jgi:lipopolysaccharide/colanic/teichoic acid biosynthesis glycosyltransferase